MNKSNSCHCQPSHCFIKYVHYILFCLSHCVLNLYLVADYCALIILGQKTRLTMFSVLFNSLFHKSRTRNVVLTYKAFTVIFDPWIIESPEGNFESHNVASTFILLTPRINPVATKVKPFHHTMRLYYIVISGLNLQLLESCAFYWVI